MLGNMNTFSCHYQQYLHRKERERERERERESIHGSRPDQREDKSKYYTDDADKTDRNK